MLVLFCHAAKVVLVVLYCFTSFVLIKVQSTVLEFKYYVISLDTIQSSREPMILNSTVWQGHVRHNKQSNKHQQNDTAVIVEVVTKYSSIELS